MRLLRFALCVTFLAFRHGVAVAAVLDVGPGKQYQRIEDSVAAAHSGDYIRVHALVHNKPYPHPAVSIQIANLYIGAVRGPKGELVRLDGSGFNYSSDKGAPRAIFQFEPGAHGCLVAGFEICNARNDSFDAAGILNDAANDVTVRDCKIHDNDNGVMSNGDAAKKTCSRFAVSGCLIHHNGSLKQPGLSHNVHVGGTSVMLSGCEVHSSVTGHNVKSRAHYTRVEYCFIHDSKNRAFDLVDDNDNTAAAPSSDAVLLGNLVILKFNDKLSKDVIHFGADTEHEHNGTLYVVHNTFLTQYVSPVLELSNAGAHAVLEGNLLWSNTGETELVAFRSGAKPANVSVANNWFRPAYQRPDGADFGPGNVFAQGRDGPSFAAVSKAGGHLMGELADYFGRITGTAIDQLKLPTAPGEANPFNKFQQYKSPLRIEPRSDSSNPCVGAFAPGK